jgi:eukaryotic-like serine/threonine-protein kinase
MFGEPVSSGSEDSSRSWKPKGYLAWLEAKTLVRGRYELRGYVGSGHIGSVFVAQHIGFDETVALKFLQPRYLASPDTAASFVREARVSFKLRSEHIARVYDVDVHEEVPFIATELLEGQTLRAVLKQRGALGRASSVDYALQACEALACAHGVGSLHLDVKPENVFVLGDEHLKLADFGISQITAAESSGASLRYVAPERIRAAAAADARSDVWSLACVLYEMLSGRAAFDRGSMLATCAAVLEEEPAPLTMVPDGLWAVLTRCLQKSPDARYHDVAELAVALEPFGSGRYRHYADRCRSQLRPSTVPKAPATAVSVQPTTMVLGDSSAPEPQPPEARKQASRMATLAFDVSAFASPAEAVRELEAAQAAEPEPSPAAAPAPTEAEQPVAQRRPNKPGQLLLLTAALVSMLWGGFALLSGTEKHPESPKLMHLVTPLGK